LKVSDPQLAAAIWTSLRSRFSLTEDKADDQIIDDKLRAGVEMRGTNLWVLMFAILVASIGLNVNSTAVVIGAMLISPLMGPIIGVGYGVGILDFVLIRRSLKNLGIAMLIALITSTVYFFFSPLTAADSELLSRTTPTIWDVLIALFGGFAGIIGATRKENSNLVPGVAIATALMPPLCTAGYGLARGDWSFFGGAFFLFTINCVFIAFASALICRAFHIRQKKFVDAASAQRVRFYVTAVVLVTGLPSVYLAYQLVQQEIFKAHAKEFVAREFSLKESHVLETRILPRLKQVEVTLIGEHVPQSKLSEIADQIPTGPLAGAKLMVHQVGDNKVDMTSLRAGLLHDIYTQDKTSLEQKDKIIYQLQTQLDAMSKGRDRLKEVPGELQALYPTLDRVLISNSIDRAAGDDANLRHTVVVNVSTRGSLGASEMARIEDWLRKRTQSEDVRIFVESRAVPKPRQSR